jgi:hypothetical protein
MTLLTIIGIAIIKRHARLARLETDASLLAALGAALGPFQTLGDSGLWVLKESLMLSRPFFARSRIAENYCFSGSYMSVLGFQCLVLEKLK